MDGRRGRIDGFENEDVDVIRGEYNEGGMKEGRKERCIDIA